MKKNSSKFPNVGLVSVFFEIEAGLPLALSVLSALLMALVTLILAGIPTAMLIDFIVSSQNIADYENPRILTSFIAEFLV